MGAQRFSEILGVVFHQHSLFRGVSQLLVGYLPAYSPLLCAGTAQRRSSTSSHACELGNALHRTP